MEQLIQITIYIHAFFGGIGLISGTLNCVLKKGSRLHKKIGTCFSISMLISCSISLVISCLPQHTNALLFFISIHTIYLIILGQRVLAYKQKKQPISIIDKTISSLLLIFGLALLGYCFFCIFTYNTINILFLFFAALMLISGCFDFRFYKRVNTQSGLWLKAHIGKMLGAYIASITAFIVAGLQINHLLAWFLPSIVITPMIIYWIKKTNNIFKQNL